MLSAMVQAPLRPAADLPVRLRVLACASQGSGGDDEARLRVLLSSFETTFLPFVREHKLRSFMQCLKSLRASDHDMFVLEGTGIGTGLPAVLGALLFGLPFVLSSGDAVGPFLSARFPLASPIFHLYERLLYRCSTGFIGWTPYLVGRSLTLGARRAITCPGWAPYDVDAASQLRARDITRAEFGIPEDAVVFGLAGSLTWSDRYQYCYGLELVKAVTRSQSNACVLIVGDGSGLSHLKRAAGEALGKTIFLTGRVRRDKVPAYLAALDVGSLPQSVDGVGGFRYTTKISEYRSLGLPFVTNVNPVAYDMDRGDIWRLPGAAPWDEVFIESLSQMMKSVTLADLPVRLTGEGPDPDFNRDAQIHRVTEFLLDLTGSSWRARATGGSQ